MRITGVDKKPLCIRGCYGVTFKIQGRVIRHDTLVVSGLCADAIIGCDIINRYHLSYDASKRHVYFNNTDKLVDLPNGFAILFADGASSEGFREDSML